MLGVRMIISAGARLVLATMLGLTLSAIIVPSATTGTAWAQSAIIRAIEVEGNRRVEPETVRSYLRFTVGDPYDAFLADQSLKALFSTGLFADVNIRRSGTTVIVVVVENPVVNRVAFEGNKEVDNATLSAEVQLRSRSVFTRARAQADVQRILDVYRRQGAFAAQVEPKIIQLDQNRVDLVFEISEGGKTKVKSIQFVGNRAFSDSQLRDVTTTGETGLLSFLRSNDLYDPDRLNLDRELLRQYYLKNGYADARIVSAVADLDPSGSGFFITFTIEEGEMYTYGDIRVESAVPSVDAGSLSNQVLTETGDVYDASQVDLSIEKLTLAVAGQGYAFARVRPIPYRDPVARTIGLTYSIEEGPRVYIERINVVGNTRTRDYVIRREFRLVEGDAFNRLMVDQARKRLQNLGFFKSVDVTREPGSAADRVVLNVVLEEQSTGEISFGGGYSTSEGIIGDISLKERNLLGRGQFIQLAVSGSIERLQVDLSFTEPRFLDRNLAAGFDVFHKEVDLTSQASYKSTKTGAGVRLGFPLGEKTWLTTRYTFSYDQIDPQAGASLAVQNPDPTADPFSDYATTTSAIGFSMTYDTRNHPREPNRGLYFALSQDFAGVGGDVFYVRAIAEGRAYYPITEKITFVTRVIGGFIEGWNDEDVRLQDLFYKGGETIRGFDRAGYGPRDLGTGDALGGRVFYAGTAEVRFPLPFLPDELGLGGAFFADAGALYDTNEFAKTLDAQGRLALADDSDLRSSVGASLLWKSPLGPLRADFAYVLTSQTYDDEQQFRFGASTKF